MALQGIQLAGRVAQHSSASACKVPLDVPILQPKPIDNTQRPESPAIHDPGQSVVLIKPPVRQKLVDITNRDHVVKVQTSRELLKPQKSRESVTMELAKFLRTHPPPRDNFMSLPEGTERSRRPPFNVFRRQNSKSISAIPPKHLKLPDSAVAARTIHGHWHIAISIPVEYDYVEQSQTTSKAIPTKAETRANSMTHRPITVLKPCMLEVRTPKANEDKMTVFEHVDNHKLLQRPRSASMPLPSNSDIQEMVQRRPQRESSLAVAPQDKADDVAKPELEHAEKSSPGRSGDIVPRRQSKRSIATKSSRTDTSNKKAETNLTYRRPDSDNSTAVNAIRSIYLREGHSSKKQSSFPRVDHDLTETEAGVSPSAATIVPSGSFTFRQSVPPTKAKADSITTDLSSTNSKADEGAQDRNSLDRPRSQVIFPSNLKLGPAPTRKLPDPPGCASSNLVATRRPSNLSAAGIGRKSIEGLGRSRGGSISDGSVVGRSDISSTDQQSRRERVKAIRSRDIAAARATTTYHRVMASVSGPPGSSPIIQRKVNREVLRSGLPSIEGRMDLPLPDSKKRSPSVSVTTAIPNAQANVITLSPVMLVADVEPSSACSENSNFSFSSQKTHSGRGRSQRNTFGKVPMPIRSLTPSLASSDEEDFHGSRDRPMSSPGNSGRRSPGGEHHAARIRRHLSLQEDSIDSRMRKIEATNRLMLQSLNAVVEMEARSRRANTTDEELRKRAGDQFDGGLNTIEPIMRELQNAARIDGEELLIDQNDSGYYEFVEVIST